MCTGVQILMNAKKTMVTAHIIVTIQLVATNAIVKMDSYWQMMTTLAMVRHPITFRHKGPSSIDFI